MTLATQPQPTALIAPPPPQPIWRNVSFMGLWCSQVLSQLADRIIFVVFISFITTYYGAAESFTSYLYVAFTIPAILLTAVAGVFVDRWPRRTTLLMTNILRALLVLLIPFMAKAGLVSIYGLAFLLSCVTQFFVPAESATIPCIVPKSQLLEANSMFTTTMMASIIFGFALGDPLIEGLGLKGVHWALFGLFTLATISLLFVEGPPYTTCPSPPSEEWRNSITLMENPTLEDAFEPTEVEAPKTLAQATQAFINELKEGIHYLKETPVVWRAMLKLALLFSAVVALSILAISYAKAFLYEDATLAARKFAFIITMAGVGMSIGAGLVSTVLKRVWPTLLIYAGMLIIFLGLLCMVLVPTVFRSQQAMAYAIPAWQWMNLGMGEVAVTQRMLATYVASLITGVGSAFLAIPVQAFLHSRIPEEIRGKVLGVQFTLLSTSSTLPALLAGLGTEWLGVRVMMLALALPFAIWGSRGLYGCLVKGHRKFC
jgi:MFS family permease